MPYTLIVEGGVIVDANKAEPAPFYKETNYIGWEEYQLDIENQNTLNTYLVMFCF